MATYIEFKTSRGPILVEATIDEIPDADGVVKAGLQERVSRAVVAARTGLDEAVRSCLDGTVTAFLDALEELPKPPSTVSISFGIKATGELSNVAIGKVGGDVNYGVVLTWEAQA